VPRADPTGHRQGRTAAQRPTAHCGKDTRTFQCIALARGNPGETPDGGNQRHALPPSTAAETTPLSCNAPGDASADRRAVHDIAKLVDAYYVSVQMHAPGVTLVFESLTWQSALAVAGAVVLLAEALATLAPLRRARGAIFWIVLLAVGLAGVVLAWVWGSWAGSLTPLTRPLFASRSLPLLSRAALLAAMPTLVAACLLATVAVFHRLFAALAGATSIAAFAAAALYGLALLAVASLMALWVPHGAVVAIGLAAISWAARSYRRTTSPVGRWIKAALLGLRIAVLLLLTLWALRPTLEYKHQEEVRTVLLICVDTSSSMERRDVVGAGSATQATQEAEPVSRIQESFYPTVASWLNWLRRPTLNWCRSPPARPNPGAFRTAAAAVGPAWRRRPARPRRWATHRRKRTTAMPTKEGASPASS